MKRPETAAYLEKARQMMNEGRVVVANGLPEAAGRAAYLAVYHAAQAFIFDVTGRVAKTHRGLRSEFARLARTDPRIDRAFPTYLARAYRLKENADYAIGHRSGITIAEAEQAIELSAGFVAGVAGLLEEAH